MNNNIEYTLVGDYYLPNIAISDPPDALAQDGPAPIGRYGKMRRVFLIEHRPIEHS